MKLTLISKRNLLISESGSAFVWVIVLCAICILVSFGVVNLGSATKNASLAQNAADAAALSAAYDVAHSKASSACSSAGFAASRNKSRLIHCEVSSDEVKVEVVLEGDSDAKARARAEIE